MDLDQVIIEKLDKIQEDVTELRIVNAKQTKDIERNADDLELHMKRTDLLEEKLDLQKKATNARFQKIEAPRTTFKNLGKYLIYAGTIGTACYGLYKGYLALQHLL